MWWLIGLNLIECFSLPFAPCICMYTAVFFLMMARGATGADGPQVECQSRGFMRPAIMAYIVASMIIVFTTGITGASDSPRNQPATPTIKRVRRSASSIFNELGPGYMSRAYRMDEQAFWSLHRKLYPHMGYKVRARVSSKKKGRSGARNGRIHSSVRLSAAIRFFAGGSGYDIAIVHGISYTEVFRSVWTTVDAINSCPSLKIKFPENHQAQQSIAAKFKAKSQAGFDCCVGCIDGILIWTEKPNASDCELSTCGAKKFLCGRKKKYGLNMQAVCDADRRFLDVSICHPGSTSDFLAFAISPLKHKLERHNVLGPGLCLFGDNAYVNTPYMVTPYKGVSGGSKDAYNFYQSQVRITVECSFGMLVHRWGVLRKPISSTIGLTKTTAMVMALCCLHNFCIDQKLERKQASASAPAALAQDTVDIAASGGIPLVNRRQNEFSPDQLLHGGEHYGDDASRNLRRQMETEGRRGLASGVVLPREKLHDIVVNEQLRRPPPESWRR